MGREGEPPPPPQAPTLLTLDLARCRLPAAEARALAAPLSSPAVLLRLARWLRLPRRLPADPGRLCGVRERDLAQHAHPHLRPSVAKQLSLL